MQGQQGAFVGRRSKEEVIELFGRHVSSGKARFFQSAGIPFVLGRRDGPYLYDLDGKTRIIDCHCNGGVFNLGHRNSDVMATLIESLKELDIGNHHLMSEQRAALAHRLAQLSPGNLTYTVFGVGGGEAIDLALKVARAYTRRPKVISAYGGYHGHTGLALAAGDEKWRAAFGPLAPGFLQVPFGDIDALDAVMDERTAAVLLETIPATYGMPNPGADYFPQVRSLCDRSGALLILDEVQAGLGRTGRLWAIEHFGVAPDILVIGKGLSGGIYPMTATCFREACEVVFHADPFIHISTFGGAEVGCPVALKVLEMSSDPAFLQNVWEMGQVFAEAFDLLRQRHPAVLVGLRQLGLMMGIELVNERCGPLFTKAAYDHGFLSVWADNNKRIAQLLPPLTTDRALAEEILDRVDGALTTLDRWLVGQH